MTIEELLAKYYGPMKIIRKDDSVETSETAGSGTWWEPLYGRKVWSQLNLEANPFAIIPKEPWGKSGWRILTTAAHSSGGGVQEADITGGAVPNAAQLTFVQVSEKPKTVAHAFALSEVAEFLSSVDDALDLLPEYREEIGKEHAYCIAKMLCTDVDTLASYNFESIDRVISDHVEASLVTSGDADIYDLDRDSTSTYDAYVNSNGDTDRDLSLTLIDTTLQSVWDNGGLPKVILTDTESLMRW